MCRGLHCRCRTSDSARAGNRLLWSRGAAGPRRDWVSPPRCVAGFVPDAMPGLGSVASHVIRPGSQSMSAVPPQADIALVRTLGAFNHAFTVRAAKAEQRLGL